MGLVSERLAEVLWFLQLEGGGYNTELLREQDPELWLSESVRENWKYFLVRCSGDPLVLGARPRSTS